MTTDPTRETHWQRFERYARAVGAWLLEFARAVSFRSEGKSTYTWCWIGGAACVLWLIYHPPGWVSGVFGAAGAVGAESGEVVGSVVGVAVFAAIAAMRRALNGWQPPPPQYPPYQPYQPSGYVHQPRYQPPAFDGNPSGGIPGDSEWTP